MFFVIIRKSKFDKHVEKKAGELYGKKLENNKKIYKQALKMPVCIC